jgi:hypothetical protein
MYLLLRSGQRRTMKLKVTVWKEGRGRFQIPRIQPVADLGEHKLRSIGFC